MDISVVIPTYNEKNNVLPSVEVIEPVLKRLSERYEIIFVDDSSPDGTADVIRGLQKRDANIKLVVRTKKDGIGGAHMAGFDAASYGTIITLDADLSQDPKYFNDFVKRLDEGYDMVIGSRYVEGGGSEGQTFIKKFASRIVNLLGFLILGIRIKDASHSFRAFRRSVYGEMRGTVKSKGHPDFEIEFTYRALRNGHKIAEIPMTFVESSGKKSNINFFTAFFDYLRALIRIKAG